eukprot:47112_1
MAQQQKDDKNADKQQQTKPSFTENVSADVTQAIQSTLRGWDKFKSWERNGAYLRTIGGLFCIAFCLYWAIAGATFALLFHQYTSLIVSFFDKSITTTWNVLPTATKIAILISGLLLVAFRSYVAIFLFPIQIVASLCSFKLGLDLAVKNMTKHKKDS